MKLNPIALLTVITMLNLTPMVVFAQNGSNDAAPATSSSDMGIPPSMGTSNAPMGQEGSEMLPLQQKGAGSASGAQGQGGTMGSSAMDSDSNNGGSMSGSSSN